MPLPKTADAIIFPEGMFKGMRSRDATPMHAINRIFGPLLGTRKVWSNRTPLGFCLATDTLGHKGKGLRFGSIHPRAGQEAYLWYRAIRRGDDVTLGEEVPGFAYHDGEILIGYRKPDEEPAVRGAAAASTEQSRLDAALDPQIQRDRIARWHAEGILTADERDKALAEIPKPADTAESGKGPAQAKTGK